MGINLGLSPAHALNVALVLISMSGHVSPQFHVVQDDEFSTVIFMRISYVPPQWAKLVVEKYFGPNTEWYKVTDTWDVPELKPASVAHVPRVPALAPNTEENLMSIPGHQKYHTID